MNLRDKLKVILPEILPANPDEPIKGTELIRMVKLQLAEEYSDATLRYHFSIMSLDPAAPIAKVVQGQGYYLRTLAMTSGGQGHVTPFQAKLGLLYENQPEILDLALARQHKLRAIFSRQAENLGQFAFRFESSFGAEAPYENVWKCPDAAVVDWQMGEAVDGSFRLDPDVLTLKRQLGLPAFSITSVKLKLQVSYNSVREDFFQALSNASWANQGELVIAAPLEDEQLLEDLRSLGTEYGLGISTLGITMDSLDNLPPHWAIPQLSEREFEALQERLNPKRVTAATKPRPFSWPVLERIRHDNSDFHTLLAWIQRCLKDGKAHTFAEYVKLSGAELLKEGM
jgi:hypothetical protein